MNIDPRIPVFGCMVLIGIGLIGSSLARAIRRYHLVDSIIGIDCSEAVLAKAQALNLVDRMVTEPTDVLSEADIVMICTPVGSYADLARRIGPFLRAGTIVSDVGSVKQVMIDTFGPHLPEGVHLVPGHPVAGTEHSGIDAGVDDLFADRWCILTPEPGTDAEAITKVATLWQRCGAMIEIMDSDHHDKILALTSHLPHLIAYTIVGTAVDLEASTQSEVIKFSAGGFRDFTRIAASDPIMWRDIFLSNREAVLEILQRFTADLTTLHHAILKNQGEILESLFTRTRVIRRKVIAAHQD